jgi:hypothetical protein
MYALLIVLRVLVGVFLTGYVHPDEFFQGGQELFFGCPPFVPWELEPRHAVRSNRPTDCHDVVASSAVFMGHWNRIGTVDGQGGPCRSSDGGVRSRLC